MHRIAVFASGKGTNFEAIVTACNNAELDAQVVLLVCDKPQAEVVAKAERFGIECFAFNPKEYSSKEQYEAQIVELLDRAEVELVCLAGYMRIVGQRLLSAYGGRIINIHPSRFRFLCPRRVGSSPTIRTKKSGTPMGSRFSYCIGGRTRTILNATVRWTVAGCQLYILFLFRQEKYQKNAT